MEDIKEERFQFYNEDCFETFKRIKDKSLDLVIVDLPYGQTDCKWDIIIPFDKMWDELKRISKLNTQFLFFCTTKFGNQIINSNPKWFRYDLIWEKSRKVGFLDSKKKPLRKHELIYVFSNPGNNNDVGNKRNKTLREYSEKIFKEIPDSIKEINNKIGNMGISHFKGFNGVQFRLPIKENYEKLTKFYNLEKLNYYLDYKTLKSLWEKNENIIKTYNPQMEEGTPYETKTNKIIDSIYGKKKITSKKNKGTRYPSSIIKFNNPKKSIHPTQKPVEIYDWLIKTYSNENDLVMDFCLGSGTGLISAMRTNRRFIGCELNKEYFDKIKERYEEELKIKT